MYRSFFHIDALPFGSSPDPRFLYVMPQTRETLACLQYGIAGRKGFAVLTGEVGTGKTTLLKTVLHTFNKARVSTAFVFNPRLDDIDFLEFVLTDFGIPPKTRTKSGMLIQLNNWLIEQFSAERVCALVVDEAQNLSCNLLEEIRLLTNLETSSQKLLQIILSGQPEFEDRLREPSLRQLRQRVSLWCRTQALTAEETRAYIAERLRIAGAREFVFSGEALESIHRHSSGIPRLINLLCEHSLINAYVEQVKPIPGRIVDAVSAELSLEAQPPLISPGASLEPDVISPPLKSMRAWKEQKI